MPNRFDQLYNQGRMTAVHFDVLRRQRDAEKQVEETSECTFTPIVDSRVARQRMLTLPPPKLADRVVDRLRKGTSDRERRDRQQLPREPLSPPLPSPVATKRRGAAARPFSFGDGTRDQYKIALFKRLPLASMTSTESSDEPAATDPSVIVEVTRDDPATGELISLGKFVLRPDSDCRSIATEFGDRNSLNLHQIEKLIKNLENSKMQNFS